MIGLLFLAGCKGKQEELLFDQLSISQICNQEQSLSKVYDGYDHGVLAKSFYPKENVTLDKSLLSVRKLKLGLPLKTKYYFSPSDSLVKFILYEWNVVTPEMTPDEINKHTTNNLDYHQDYVQKFNSLAKRYTEKYGAPSSGDGALQKEKFQNLERNYATYTWDLDNQVIELSISLIPTLSYRVITKVYWKEE